MNQMQPQQFSVIEGRISLFQWAEGSENLFEKIKEGSKQRNALAAIAAAAMNRYGTSASASAYLLATYDGEYKENFACVVDDKVVHGQFSGARKLKDGDNVKVVVSETARGVLFAHAVQRPADGLLWLPSQVYCGDRAALKAALQSVKVGSIVVWVALVIASIGGNAIAKTSLSAAALVGFAALFAIVTPLIGLFGTFFPTRNGKEFGVMGSKIFSLLNFPDPDNQNLEFARLVFQCNEERVDDVYNYVLALESFRTGTAIPTKSTRQAMP